MGHHRQFVYIFGFVDICLIPPPPPGQKKLSVILVPKDNGGEPQQEKQLCIIDYPITNRVLTFLLRFDQSAKRLAEVWVVPTLQPGGHRPVGGLQMLKRHPDSWLVSTNVLNSRQRTLEERGDGSQMLKSESGICTSGVFGSKFSIPEHIVHFLPAR